MTTDDSMTYTPMDIGRKEARSLYAVFHRIAAEIKTGEREGLLLAFTLAKGCREDFERLVAHHKEEDAEKLAQKRWEESEKKAQPKEAVTVQPSRFVSLSAEEMQRRWHSRYGHSIAEGR